MSRLTIRQRLTILFTAGFLLSGFIVQAIVFWRLDERLSADVAAQRPPEFLDLPEGAVGAENVLLPDGRSLADIIRIAQADFRSETLAELALWTGVALAITALLAAVLGRVLAIRALQPIERITDATQWITASSLDTRLDWNGPADELAELAETIDDMLARIDDGVAAQRQFAAMASHELRTPLAVIEVESELARRDPASTTTLELAERTGSAASRARELVSKLLLLARSQSGIQSRQVVELWEIADQALSSRLELADDAGVTVHFEPGSASVHGDPSLLESLAVNLIENGIRHNHSGGELAISTATVADGAELRVQNSGAPIDASTLARISEPFRRGDDNPDDLGHGLGLTIARTIVDRHGGTMTLAPNETGGLAVRVLFPQA